MVQTRRFLNSLLPAILSIGFGAALVVINIIRIFSVSITFDETGYDLRYSYYFLMRDSIGSANDHILHSLIRQFFITTFSDSLFFLRVDSLMAQITFLVFSYLICQLLFKNKWWIAGSYILLNVVSPLIFNFWGLSRGYALGLAFMAISIYYLLRYMNAKRLLFLSISFAGAILSVYSNFGYLSYFFSVAAIVIIQHLLFGKSEPKGNFRKELIVAFVPTAVLALMITAPLYSIYQKGELSFMGSKGFINDTVVSLANSGLFLSGSANELAVTIIKWTVVISTWAAGGYLLYAWFKKCFRKEDINIEVKYGITLYLLLVMPAIALIAQFVLLKINYVTDRAALFFMVLWPLHVIYWLYYLRNKLKIASVILFSAVLLLAGYNFFSKINLYNTSLWWFEGDDLSVLRRIDRESKGKEGKIKIAVSWISLPSFIYNTAHYYPGKFYPVGEVFPESKKDSSFDYFLIRIEDLPAVPLTGYSRDTQVAQGGLVLYRKN